MDKAEKRKLKQTYQQQVKQAAVTPFIDCLTCLFCYTEIEGARAGHLAQTGL